LTLLNYHTSTDRGVVVTDSLCVNNGVPAAFQPKFYLFPHAAMVITGRGPDDIQWRALWDLSHHYFAGGIDGAQKILPGLLENADAEMRARYPNATGLDSVIAAVGYSPSEGRYLAVHFQSKHGFEPEPQPPGNYLSPAAPACARPAYSKAPTAEMWIAMAKQQQRILAEEKAPAWCSIGGDLFMIELTLNGISVRKLCRLPLYEEAVAEMSRGDIDVRRGAVARAAAPGRVCPTEPIEHVGG
jgi:hypothetical protein